MRPLPAPKSDAIWQMLRVAARPMTARELALLNKVGEPFTRRALRLWAAAGFLDRIAPETAARGDAARYAINASSPREPPVISLQGEVERREGYMTATELAAIRRLTGLSLVGFAEALGRRGSKTTASREMRRYETGDRPIGMEMAEAARALIKDNQNEKKPGPA
jgi:hypothetical protein